MDIGFMIGHPDYIPHGELLSRSLMENTTLTQKGTIHSMVPSYRTMITRLPGVIAEGFDIPEKLRALPFADKMLAAAAFEQMCGQEYLWLDVDSYFFQTPQFPDGAKLCVNPVDKRNIGDPASGSRSALWQNLYQHFDLRDDQLNDFAVRTTVTGEPIHSYFNAGMVAVFDHRGLFQAVRDALLVLPEMPAVAALLAGSQANRIFLHQAVFTCAVLKLYRLEEISYLPVGVNYPLHLHHEHGSPLPPEELTSIRYDTYFEQNDVPEVWSGRFPQEKDRLRMTWYYS